MTMHKPSSKFNLNGRTALITGAAGFLGQYFSESLLEIDCTIVISDICLDVLDSLKKKYQYLYPNARIYAVYLDVTSEESVFSVSRELASLGIHVDILINNAAINPKVNSDGSLTNSSRFEDFNIDSWNTELSVGLTGAFLCTKVFGHIMADHAYGNIINIASDLSVIAPTQTLYEVSGLSDEEQTKKPVTYSVLKHGLVGLTKYTATYWAHKNVRCNSLSPGGVFNNQDSSFVQKLNIMIPLQRMCMLDDLRGLSSSFVQTLRRT